MVSQPLTIPFSPVSPIAAGIARKGRPEATMIGLPSRRPVDTRRYPTSVAGRPSGAVGKLVARQHPAQPAARALAAGYDSAGNRQLLGEQGSAAVSATPAGVTVHSTRCHQALQVTLHSGLDAGASCALGELR